MKYATCKFDHTQGYVCDNNGSLKWHEGTLKEAMMHVKNNPGSCALFLPSDLPGYGNPLYPDISREIFETEPAIYGVCYYKAWSGFVFE